jgi:protein-tyrosine phosphatase
VAAPPFDVHEVAPGVWLGPCPATPEAIRALAVDRGVAGLLSVQTDQDLERQGLSWALLWRFLMRHGVSAARVPIDDLVDDALVHGLDEAVRTLQTLRRAELTTYVHCTAGMNRSPTVVIAWLHACGGMALTDAWDQVVARRPIVVPNRVALQRWVAGGGPGRVGAA